MARVRLRDLFLVPGDTSPELPSWAHEVSRSVDVMLDLRESASQLQAASRLRIDPLRCSLLANLLSGRPQSSGVEVSLPSSASVQRQLSRTPLLAVLASHSGLLQRYPVLEPWREIWDPHSRTQRAQQAVGRSVPLAPFQRSLLTLVSPHSRPSHQLQRDVRSTVYPWLGRRFIKHGRSISRLTAMRQLELAMIELVENVGDHAAVGSTGRPPTSVAQLTTTAGGGSESVDRFRLTVMDNGIGLPRSIKSRRGDLNGVTAVRYALDGKLWQGTRGAGLHRVRGVVDKYPGSSLVIFTEFLPERHRSIVAAVDRDGSVDIREVEVGIVGTLAIAQLALPALVNEDPTLFEMDDELALASR